MHASQHSRLERLGDPGVQGPLVVLLRLEGVEEGEVFFEGCFAGEDWTAGRGVRFWGKRERTRRVLGAAHGRRTRLEGGGGKCGRGRTFLVVELDAGGVGALMVIDMRAEEERAGWEERQKTGEREESPTRRLESAAERGEGDPISTQRHDLGAPSVPAHHPGHAHACTRAEGRGQREDRKRERERASETGTHS